eukprot:TRINITY_DN3086_c0_g1_i1.p1 TRINITY_DN3086_c0_g1~~TRINITY_DN3086_c0_g1_i1.p1  ORF type:complete len:272 (-),score=44.48 TRINITY_DN3086_c0_g1_i1:69-884(-)
MASKCAFTATDVFVPASRRLYITRSTEVDSLLSGRMNSVNPLSSSRPQMQHPAMSSTATTTTVTTPVKSTIASSARNYALQRRYTTASTRPEWIYAHRNFVLAVASTAAAFGLYTSAAHEISALSDWQVQQQQEQRLQNGYRHRSITDGLLTAATVGSMSPRFGDVWESRLQSRTLSMYNTGFGYSTRSPDQHLEREIGDEALNLMRGIQQRITHALSSSSSTPNSTTKTKTVENIQSKTKTVNFMHQQQQQKQDDLKREVLLHAFASCAK